MIRKDANGNFEIINISPSLVNDKTNLGAIRAQVANWGASTNDQIVAKNAVLGMLNDMMNIPAPNSGQRFVKVQGSHLVDQFTPDEVEVIAEEEQGMNESPIIIYRDVSTGEEHRDPKRKFIGKFTPKI